MTNGYILIIVAIIGLIGVLARVILPHVFKNSRINRQKKDENIGLFLEENLKIWDYICKTEIAIKRAINFLYMNFSSCTEDELEERIYPDNVRSISGCLEAWDDFKNVLEKYFSDVIGENGFNILDKTIYGIRKLDYRSYAKEGRYIAMRTYISEDSDYFEKALKIINSVKKRHRKLKKKSNKRRI